MQVSGSATITADTTTKNGGVAAFKFTADGSGNGSWIQWSFTGATSTDYYLRAYIQLASLPSFASKVPLLKITSGGGAGYAVSINTSKQLELGWENSTNAIGSPSSALSAATWYRVELHLKSTVSADAVDFRIDGVSIASTNTGSRLLAAPGIAGFGWLAGTVASSAIYMDDCALNDSTGSAQTSWPGATLVAFSLPTSDNAAGSWKAGSAASASSNGALWDAINNTPPAGTASPDAVTACISNNVSGVTSPNYDANMATYTAAGLASGSTVNLVQLVVVHGEDVSTGTKTGTFTVVSNPAQGATDTITQFGPAAGGAVGTYPSNWAIQFGSVIYAPSVTLGTAPVCRISKTDTGTRAADCCFMGLMIDYTAPSGTTYSEGITASGTAAFSPATPNFSGNPALALPGTSSFTESGLLSTTAALLSIAGVSGFTLPAPNLSTATASLSATGTSGFGFSGSGKSYDNTLTAVGSGGFADSSLLSLFPALALPGTGAYSISALRDAISLLSLVGTSSLPFLALLDMYPALTASGSGALGIVGGLSFASALALAGNGAATGVGTLTYSQVVSFLGTGAYSDSGVFVGSPALSLAGTSNLAPVAGNSMQLAVALAAAAGVSVSGFADFISSQVLPGTGSLTGLGGVGITPTPVQLSALSAFSADSILAAFPTLALGATAAFTVLGSLAYTQLLTVAGTGSVSSTGGFDAITSVGLAGSGAFSALGLLSYLQALAIAASSALSADTTQTVHPAIQLSTVAGFACGGLVVCIPVVSLSGSGGLSPVSSLVQEQAALLSGTGTLSSSPSLTIEQTVSLAATATISAALTLATGGTVVLSGAEFFTADGNIVGSSATYNVTLALSAIGVTAQVGEVAGSPSITLTSAGAIDTRAFATLISILSILTTSNLSASALLSAQEQTRLAALGLLSLAGNLTFSQQISLISDAILRCGIVSARTLELSAGLDRHMQITSTRRAAELRSSYSPSESATSHKTDTDIEN